MITKRKNDDGTTRVTFSVIDERRVSVVGDFNNWDPFAHPLVKRSNGKRSVAVVIPEGSTICFRYLAEGGEFYDDPEADRVQSNGMGDTNCYIDAE